MSEQEKQSVFEIAQNLTGSEVGEVLSRVGVKPSCDACKTGMHEVGCMKDRAVPLAQPIPPDNEQALWFFTTMCANCGNTRFFFAPFIVAKVREIRDTNREQ